MDDGGASPDNVMDLDFMDELLFEGCWLESSDGFNFLQPSPSTNNPLPPLDPNPAHLSLDPGNAHIENPPVFYPKREFTETDFQNDLVQPGNIQSSEAGKRLWIGPGPSSSSVKERLMQAIAFLKESTTDKDVLIQIWVPIKEEGKKVLTTEGQPYSLSSKSLSLANYRKVSKTYHFSAEQDSDGNFGLPGRVFLEKLPEWTPDVRFFKSEEYPRIDFAEKYNVSGSMALPVFERGSGNCLGVVEIVTTTQKINYRPELEFVCKALEAVDLSSSADFSQPSLKVCNELHQVAVPKLAEFLASICNSHGLPSALTWAPCVRQGKYGCRHSDENYATCVSTIDSACCVASDLSEFLEACSEHHLTQGQGIVGRAFTTNKKCFATDVTAFSKKNYPLSHHARMFGLHAAVAYPLRSIYTGSIDFVLELFLPKECRDSVEQKWMLNSLSVAIQQACQSLDFVQDHELEEEVILPIKKPSVACEARLGGLETPNSRSSSKESSPEGASWIAHMMDAQEKGKGVCVSWEFQKEDPKEEFTVTTQWDNNETELYDKQVMSELEHLQQSSGPKSSGDGGENSSSFGGRRLSAGKKAGEKRRTKSEKNISLDVLRQYFAGSLKDAAKSIGVCPTTLKRICRQHGISRWPSRKIKKVGHSLRKLQLVIDSVQGAEGSIKLGSFYSSFPELSSPNLSGTSPFSPLKMSDQSKISIPQPDNGLFTLGPSGPKSPSSSCSHSSGSTTCCSTGAKQLHIAVANPSTTAGALLPDEPGVFMKRVCSEAEFLVSNHEAPKFLARSQSHKILGEHLNAEILPPLPKIGSRAPPESGVFKVKANFGEEKVRFTLVPNWGFKELQQEITSRFKIEDVTRIDLKYLDDDSEWVLLTCDADLEECVDIYRSAQSHTIKVSVHHTCQRSILGSSFGSRGSS
ncbi:hypothetical protein ACFE04_012004 [Oxalis oulophora]